MRWSFKIAEALNTGVEAPLCAGCAATRPGADRDGPPAGPQLSRRRPGLPLANGISVPQVPYVRARIAAGSFQKLFYALRMHCCTPKRL